MFNLPNIFLSPNKCIIYIIYLQKLLKTYLILPLPFHSPGYATKS